MLWPKQESKYVIYLCANNLYAKFRFLPISGFKWINPKELDSNKYSSNSVKCFVLEVDLGYPKELCVLNSNHPLAPDKIEIKRGMLSNYLKILIIFLLVLLQKMVQSSLIKKRLRFIMKTCNLI